MKMTKFLIISWEKLHQTCFKIAKVFLNENIKINRIVAISRGGLVVARIFSDYLNLPISPFTMVAYTGMAKKKKPRLAEGLKANIKNEIILLIDEVADSGETFIEGLKYLKQFKPKKIYTLAPFMKTWTKFKPDFCQTKTDKWIIFPYDIRETIKEIKHCLIKKKLSNNELIIKLTSLGLPKNQAAYFLSKS